LYSNTQTSNGLCFRTQWSAIHVESLRTMRRHLDDRQRLTFPEDSTFEISDTLKNLPTQTSLCYLVFYPFLLLIFPSAVAFGALIRQSAFGNTLMSTHPVFGNIGSCPCALAPTTSVPSPRVSHNRKRKKVHMFRFRPPRLLALSLLVYYNAMYHKDMGKKPPTNCSILSFINHLDSRKASEIVQ